MQVCMALMPVVCLGVKIGFLGDSGAQTSSSSTGYYGKAVYDMMRTNGVDLVLQNGDFDYQGSPSTWESFLNANSGNMLYLMSAGNHEAEIDVGDFDSFSLLRQSELLTFVFVCLF